MSLVLTFNLSTELFAQLAQSLEPYSSGLPVPADGLDLGNIHQTPVALVFGQGPKSPADLRLFQSLVAKFPSSLFAFLIPDISPLGLNRLLSFGIHRVAIVSPNKPSMNESFERIWKTIFCRENNNIAKGFAGSPISYLSSRQSSYLAAICFRMNAGNYSETMDIHDGDSGSVPARRFDQEPVRFSSRYPSLNRWERLIYRTDLRSDSENNQDLPAAAQAPAGSRYSTGRHQSLDAT